MSHTHLTTFGGMSLLCLLMVILRSRSICGIMCLNQRLNVRWLTPAARANSDLSIDFIDTVALRMFVLCTYFCFTYCCFAYFCVVYVTAGGSDTPQSRLCGDPVSARVPNRVWSDGSGDPNDPGVRIPHFPQHGLAPAKPLLFLSTSHKSPIKDERQGRKIAKKKEKKQKNSTLLFVCQFFFVTLRHFCA